MLQHIQLILFFNLRGSMTTRKNKILKGMLLSYFITITNFCLFAALFSYTNMSDSCMPLIVKITAIVSISLGALTSSKNICNKGWLNGAIIGILYTVTLLIIYSFFSKNFCLTAKFFQTLIANTLMGIFGGIVGINSKTTKK